MRVVALDTHREGRRQLDLELGADGARPVVLRTIGEIAVVSVVGAGDTQRGGVAEAEVDSRLGVHRVEVAVAPDGVARGLAQVGLHWDHVDRTRCRVASVERALRPLEHLHALEIEEGPEGRAGPGEIDAVDVESRRGIGSGGEGVVADAADEDQVALATRRHGECGRKLTKRLQSADVGVDQIRARHDGDRDGRLLQVLAARLRGHDDLLKAFRLHRGRSRGVRLADLSRALRRGRRRRGRCRSGSRGLRLISLSLGAGAGRRLARRHLRHGRQGHDQQRNGSLQDSLADSVHHVPPLRLIDFPSRRRDGSDSATGAPRSTRTLAEAASRWKPRMMVEWTDQERALRPSS